MGDRRRIALMSLAYDAGMAVVAGALAIALRNGLHLRILHGATRFHIDWSSFLVVGLLLTVFWLHGLYKAEAYVSWRVHLRLVVRALVVTVVLAAAAMYVLHASSSFGSRVVTGVAFAFLFSAATLGRVFVLGSVARRMLDPNARTLLVGMAPGLERLSRRLSGLPTYGHVDLLEVNGYDAEQLKGHVLQLVQESRAQRAAHIRNVFIDALSMSPEDVVLLSQAAKELGCDVYVASMLVHALASRRLLEDLFETPTVRVRSTLGQAVQSPAKRVFDVAGALLALLVLWPLLAVIAVAVKATSGSPVIFAQTRVGRGGRFFKFYKFRSMVAGSGPEEHRRFVSEFIQGTLEGAAPNGGRYTPFKMTADPRVTRVGALLRRFSLDELPQLWNVLKGDMSLVGPRPPLPYEVDTYMPWHRLRLVPTPGISGLWQVQGRSRVTFDEMVLQDVMYACNRSVLTDGAICWRTIPAAILGRGAA